MTDCCEVAPTGRKIVVGYDGSEEAERALAQAAAVAGREDRIVIVAVAVPYPRSGVTIPVNRDAAEIQQRRHDLLVADTFLSTRGLRAETVEARGEPADALLAAATDAELLVVGSRKLNRLQLLVLGSVSSKVAHDAPCDVLVVR